jgi:predicted ATPase
MQAIKMVLDRVMPARKDRSIAIDIPSLKNSADILQAMSSITDSVGSGNISPTEGEALSRIIDVYVKALEIHDYENRLQILENKHQ